MCSGCIERDGLTREQRALRQAEFMARIDAAEQAPPEGESDDHIVVVQGFTPRPLVRAVPAEWLTSPPSVMGGSGVDPVLIEDAEEAPPRSDMDVPPVASDGDMMPPDAFNAIIEAGPQIIDEDEHTFIVVPSGGGGPVRHQRTGVTAAHRRIGHASTPKG